MGVTAELRERLRGEFGARILENEPMSAHCSFRIGGEIALMLSPESDSQAAAVYRALSESGARVIIMGNGTNLLVTDSPIDAAALRIGDGTARIEYLGNGRIYAGAGAALSKVANEAARLSLTGLEFAQGIPGTLGGGVFMNAGAYGGELRDVVESVRAATPGGEIVELSNGECDFSYRYSVFCENGLLILGATVSLREGDGEIIRETMRTLSEKRRSSQPLDIPSVGSTFKRPAGGYAAALIDEAGLKGFAVGAAQVSEKHAGFVVNRGGATFRDVMELIEHIRKTVYDRSGILLEPEVRIIED